MSIWDAYPLDYRSQEIQQILRAARAGECCAVIGLSGAGKTNLLSFLVHRVKDAVEFIFVDCNRLTAASEQGFWQLLASSLGCCDDLAAIEKAIGARLSSPSSRLCLVIDRFDALPGDAQAALAGGLRALRDRYKYQLSYTLGIRAWAGEDNEMMELFYAHTIWLGPLTRSDAHWSVHQFALRNGLSWLDEAADRIYDLSRGYPALLRAICHAYAAGTLLTLPDLKASQPVQQMVREFWQEEHSLETLRRCGLADLELLKRPATNDPDEALTAKEHLLLRVLRSHAGDICEKDDLIQAVWPEDRIYGDGIRDDSLAQLVRRLRKKVGAGQIETIPGRGYRWRGS